MRRITNLRFSKIVLCVIFVTILFAFQSCKTDQPSADRSASLGISTDDGFPSWSPDGTRIIFNSRRDNNAEIYIMDADGSNPTRLTDNPAYDWDPSISPDSKKIVFFSERDGNSEIYSMNADGSNQTRLTIEPADDLFPAWSPDSRKIAFQSRRDGNSEIYTMNADGTNQTKLTNNPAGGGAPAWSPDGTRIAFHSNRDGNAEIYIINADGSNPTRLTNDPAKDLYPSWSPDGNRIVFFSDRDGNPEIYTMNADGSNQTRLTNEPAHDYYPSWSPDGQKIVFVSGRDFVNEVYVMDADGSNPVNLTNNAPVNKTFGLVPLAQSELNLEAIPYKIVFETYRETDSKENWDICIIDADGGNLINLTNTPEIDEMYPHVSPDGRRICFVADEGEDLESKRRNVYTMNINGTDRVKIAENAYQPCWSPDGKHIAYLPGEFPKYNSDKRANKGLEIYDIETGDVKRHPNDQIIHLARLCWSPDGEWFVSAGSRDMPGGEDAFKVDDKTMIRLSMVGCTPDISPDGKLLIYNGEDWNLNIGELDFDSIQHSVINHKVVVTCDRDHWVYHADWSPDGNYLTFTYAPYDGSASQSRPAPGSNICVCDLMTGKWTQITTDGKHNKEPDWVPSQIK